MSRRRTLPAAVLGGAGGSGQGGTSGGTSTLGVSNRPLPATGGTPALLALGLLVGCAAVVRAKRT